MENESKVLFITATHGDESFSVGILNNIAGKYPGEIFGYSTIIGNPQALSSGRRYIEADLNRVAPGSLDSKIYEVRRAAEIIEATGSFDYVVDIHGTVADCGIVTIIPYPTIGNILLASLLRIRNNIIWYDKTSLEKGPLVQFSKCPGIEIECGSKTDAWIHGELQSVLEEFILSRRSTDSGRLVAGMRDKNFYSVYGLQSSDGNQYKDFCAAEDSTGEFYPFLSNQYPGIGCYKMKKVQFESFFLT
jgi:hypothetical protein